MAERDDGRTRGAASLYRERIARLVPDCDPRHVEAAMRVEFGTLDQLIGQRFAQEARAAAVVVRADRQLAERTAWSMGL